MKRYDTKIRLIAMRLWQSNLNPFEIFLYALLVLGVLGVGVVMPRLENQIQQNALVLEKRKENAVVVVVEPPSVAELNDENINEFYQTLGSRVDAGQPIKSFFSTAAASGLSIGQADYVYRTDKAGNFSTYQITIPVKATYAGIREFSEKILKEISFAALQEITFSRENISSGVVDARLVFVLYLDDKVDAPRPEQASLRKAL